jgi:hypothetical protein
MSIGKDYSDWGGYPVSGQSYPLKDMAELAVRLGSPVSFERSGAVYYINTLAHGLGMFVLGGDAAARYPTLACDYSPTSGYAVKMNPGNSAAQYSELLAHLSMPPASKWGISWRLSLGAIRGVFMAMFYQRRAPDVWAYGLKLDWTTRLMQVYNDAAGWTTVLSLPAPVDYLSVFSFVKVVFDSVNHTYVRVRLDDLIVADGFPDVYHATGEVNNFLVCDWMSVGHASYNVDVRLSDVILTYNET